MNHMILLDRMQKLRKNVITRERTTVLQLSQGCESRHRPYAFLTRSTIRVPATVILTDPYVLKGNRPVCYESRLLEARHIQSVVLDLEMGATVVRIKQRV